MNPTQQKTHKRNFFIWSQVFFVSKVQLLYNLLLTGSFLYASLKASNHWRLTAAFHKFV